MSTAALTAVDASAFPRAGHPGVVAAAERSALIADPGFGTVFTDHMAQLRWTEGRGWHDGAIVPRAPLSLDPACAVLHYAQEIFEGMKAYRLAGGDGGEADIGLFRPDANARRFRASARRMAMPELPEPLFLGSVEALVAADRDWIPTMEGGSLYLRPFMFASETFLGVRPAKEYLYLVIASAVGPYFKSGRSAIRIWASESYSRAGPGGTGAAKCGGNYAASLIAQAEAIAEGCDQVVFLDAAEGRHVEELGGMNLFFLFDDGRILTPPLSGTILPGITRDSLITLARDAGLSVVEDNYALDQWRADADSGRLVECFACGTAAVVTPVGEVAGSFGSFTIGSGSAGQMTERLKAELTGIQRGTRPDPYGWLHRIA